METQMQFWRALALLSVVATAFMLGQGARRPADAATKSPPVNLSHISTNQEGDVLWSYDYDGASREWVVSRVDFVRGEVDVKVIEHPRVPGSY